MFAAFRLLGEAVGAGPVNLKKRKLRGISSIYINVSEAGVKEVVPESFQLCPGTG